jgi:hypothetical protein
MLICRIIVVSAAETLANPEHEIPTYSQAGSILNKSKLPRFETMGICS